MAEERIWNSFATIKYAYTKLLEKIRFTEMNICSQKTQMHAEVEQSYSGFIDMNICSQEI
ncbi:MAG: hypothetical protein KAR55_00125 [Thermoplasmatales archaeon]|nr:hypothetical protein [Thermoplasmatales archaeon]